MGVAADEVPRRAQLPDLRGREKSPTTDQPSGDEEMAAPPSPAQLVTNRQGTLAPIIERQQQVPSGPREIQLIDQRRLHRSRGDLVQVLSKLPGTQAIRAG